MKIRFLILCLLSSAQIWAQQDFTKWVNPFIGTGGHGHTFPGATTPFGMVQLSPDTRIDGSWDGCSGYHYSDSTIYGFSHTHLSGTGCSDYGDIMLMPINGEASFDNKKYASSFSHKNEKATPGYYSVKLNNGVQVELTATTRTGWHRYYFPAEEASVVLDLRHRDELLSGDIRIINDSTVLVKRISRAWAQEQHAYACLNFSSRFKYSFNKDKSKVIFSFKLKNKNPLVIKTGYSLVSEKGAEKNLKVESKGLNFEKVVQMAKASWNKELSKIEARDEDEKLINFYTALYHVMIHPNVAMDVDGSYRGRDNKIHIAQGYTYYTVFSLWDTFRALHPLLSIIDEKRTLDFVNTFLTQYDEGGRLPVWELSSNETDCMIGIHSIPVITDAYCKGIRAFDINKAFNAMEGSLSTEKFGFPVFKKQGFLMVDDESESVSKTLEYAYDLWCIAQLQILSGNRKNLEENISLSNAWKNLYDPSTGFMRPRKNGGWLSPFEPREVNNHFTEGNSWQYSFFVPHDIEGLIKAMGGKKAFEAKLDALFSAPTQTTGRTQADITGLIGQYAHGNEPSHHMAYLYNYVNQPEKTTQLVYKILQEYYLPQPDGLIGNEDCGQMSAWYVMSALGLYQVCPGMPKYCVIPPFLQSYKVNLESGGYFDADMILQQTKASPFMLHVELTGEKNNYSYHSSSHIESISSEYIPAPLIIAKSRSFNDSMLIKILPLKNGKIQFEFTEDGKTGKEEQIIDTDSFWIKSSGIISATERLSTEGMTANPLSPSVSRTVTGRFYKNSHPDWDIQLNCKYNVQYSAGGPTGIIDGIQGSVDWRKGEWQGYQSQDFEAIVDMQSEKNIRHFSGRFLQDTRSWILMPSKVEYYVSKDGRSFEKVAEIGNDVAPNDYTNQIKDFSTNTSTPISARYVKVRATNFGKLPEWHAGAGEDAFIFVDEIDFK